MGKLTIFILLLTTLLSYTQAQQVSQPSQTIIERPELILIVKPRLCLRYSSSDSCEISVEVVWRDKNISDYCLHSIQEESAIRCWQDTRGARMEEQRSMDKDLVYWLSMPGQQDRIVEATIELATIVNDEKRRRTKRRHVWNLI